MMSRRPNISQRDQEMLSAYLDGQLEDRQKRKLQARLQEDPGLRAELETLRVTVRSLRDLPAPRLRRHFTLSPEMVGQREQRRAYPVLRFATAIAGFIFIALVGLEALRSVSGDLIAAQAPAVMRESEMVQDEVTSAEAPMVSAPEEQPPMEAEALEMPAEEEAAEEPQALMMEEPEAAVEAPAAEAESPAAEDQTQKVVGTPEVTPSTGMVAGEQPEARASGVIEEGGAQQLGEVETGDEVAEEAPNFAYAQEAEPTTATWLSPLRLLQALTGVLFVILSVLTITFRKRSK
jgi:hypothetical protein